jgi:hypothetical protein
MAGPTMICSVSTASCSRSIAAGQPYPPNFSAQPWDLGMVTWVIHCRGACRSWFAVRANGFCPRAVLRGRAPKGTARAEGFSTMRTGPTVGCSEPPEDRTSMASSGGEGGGAPPVQAGGTCSIEMQDLVNGARMWVLAQFP